MKCKDCHACKGKVVGDKMRYFCNGVKDPFVITDINHECTEYPERRDIVSKSDIDFMKDAYQAANHPSHYGGENNTYEARKVIKAWGLNFNTGNVAKYLSRAGKKDLKGDVLKSTLEDLVKARQYLDFEIDELNEKLEAIAYQD